MKAFLELIKILFIQQYRIKPIGNKKKQIGTIIALVVLALCFLPMIIGMAIIMYYIGKISAGNVGFCALLILMCQSLVMLFGLPAIISNVFNCKDADKLLPLPLKPISIFSAKLCVVYINEVLTTVLVILVTLLPFGIGSGAQVGFYFLLVLATLLIPMLPMLLGTIIAMPFVALTLKLSKNSVVKTIMQIFLFITIFALYFALLYFTGAMSGMENAENVDIATMLIQKLNGLSNSMLYIHSNFTLASAMLATSFGTGILNLLISTAENILLITCVILMSLAFYNWMLRTSLEGGGIKKRKATSKDLEVKNKGLIKELIFTDLKRVSRDSQLGFSSLMGIILLPVMVIVFFFVLNSMGEDGNSSLEILYGLNLYQPLATLAILAYMSMLGITANTLGIFPISRENKSFYMVKSLPISFNKYLLSKVILATSVMLICDFITCLFVVIFLKIMWYWGITMLLTMTLVGFGSMCITTLIDLKSPKLGWTNFNQSLKNAKNSWLAMLIGLVTSLITATISAPFIYWYSVNSAWFVLLIMWIIVIICAIAYALVCYKIMTKKATDYFDKIEA